MHNLPQLTAAVQRNCDISDARYAGEYGLCTFLLKMREYYRWESELPFAHALPKDELGEWLKTREQQWNGIAAEDFAPLPLARGELNPFGADAANRELLPQGCVYSAGYGRFQKPTFFLGRLLRVEERADLTILVSSCEYARELASYDFVADAEAALQRMADNEMESMILHEIGEAMAGELLGEAWREMTLSVACTKCEPLARAVRDLLADCLSTLPTLLERANLPALHFHFATFDAPRRQLLPQALEAYEHFLRDGGLDRLRRVVREGGERWLVTARRLLALDPAARLTVMEALLEDASACEGAGSAR